MIRLRDVRWIERLLEFQKRLFFRFRDLPVGFNHEVGELKDGVACAFGVVRAMTGVISFEVRDADGRAVEPLLNGGAEGLRSRERKGIAPTIELEILANLFVIVLFLLVPDLSQINKALGDEAQLVMQHLAPRGRRALSSPDRLDAHVERRV